MNIIIGYGNNLRGEDAFGLDVADYLQTLNLPNTKIIKTFQLTPELTLEIQDAKKIIFVDAALGSPHYAIACPLKVDNNGFTHHVSPHMIISMLNTLYDSFPEYFVYSILTNAFDKIENKTIYKDRVTLLGQYISFK